jgi:flagellar basal-body rod modification protein FlgD
MTSAIEAVPPITALLGAQPPKETKPTNDLDKDAFLKLLVAQLKYQDPMNPASGTEFIAQTAQFTQVEKLTELADIDQKLLTAQLNLGASSLVGRTITYTGTDGVEASGVVSGAVLNASSPTVRVGSTDVPLSSVKDVHITAAG